MPRLEATHNLARSKTPFVAIFMYAFCSGGCNCHGRDRLASAARAAGGGFDNAWRLHMLGKDAAATTYLCRVNGAIRLAFKDNDHPCPQVWPKVDQIDAAPSTPTRTGYRYDYCFTASAVELRQHWECVRQGL